MVQKRGSLNVDVNTKIFSKWKNVKHMALRYRQRRHIYMHKMIRIMLQNFTHIYQLKDMKDIGPISSRLLDVYSRILEYKNVKSYYDWR